MNHGHRPALVALFLCFAVNAGAEEPSDGTDTVLSGGFAVASFTQGDQAPPLCCGERDSWNTYGPELRAGFGYRLLPWLEPGVDVGASRLTGGREGLRIALFKLDVAPRVSFPFGDPVFFAPRVAWHFAHVAADFERSTVSESENALLMGPGLGLGAGYRLSAELGIGLDASLELIANAELSRSWHFGAVASWFP